MKKPNKNLILFSAIIFSSIVLQNKASIINKVPSIKEFEELVKKNDFLIKMKDNDPLTKDEKIVINQALKDQKTKYTPTINRPIKDFKGEILVVGGGKKWGTRQHMKNEGITNIEKAIEENKKTVAHQNKIQRLIKDIEFIKSGEYLDKKCKDRQSFDSGESFSQKMPEEQILKNLNTKLLEEKSNLSNAKKKISEEILKKYYTINFDASVDPDLIISITDINGLKCIPDRKFNHIYLELIDAWVFLNPNTWKFLERVCKPGGTIKIVTGIIGLRFLPIIIKGTKWEKPILEIYKTNYQKMKQLGGINFLIKNK